MSLLTRIAPQLIALVALALLVTLFYPGFLKLGISNDAELFAYAFEERLGNAGGMGSGAEKGGP